MVEIGGSRWGGFGSAFRSISAKMFSEDLAGELEPIAATQGTRSRTRPVEGEAPTRNLSPKRNSAIDGLPKQQQGTRDLGFLPPTVHMGETPEYQVNPEYLSPDQLQSKMKQLTKQHDLWVLFKEQLADQDHPNNPEIVRSVLIEFIKVQGHQIRDASRPSIFQTFNTNLDEESTHTSRLPKGSTAAADDPEGLSPDELQLKMKELMEKPDLWSEYKQRLSQENEPSKPETIRRVLIEFLNDNEFEIHGKAGIAFFQGLSDSHQVRTLTVDPEKEKREGIKQKMKLLRAHPTLYTQYQHRLEFAKAGMDGKDLLVAFLEEHNEKLDEFEKKEEESRGFSATLGSHLEAEAATFNQPTKTVMPLKERPSILGALNASIHHVTESFNTTIRPSILAALNESMHQVTESSNATLNERMFLKNKMKFLRKHPTLYEHYQQRLKVAETEINGKDLLVAFLKEHKEELDEFEKEEEEAGGFAATLGLLNANLHLEAEAAAFNQPTKTSMTLKERPSILAALNESMHQVTESSNATLNKRMSLNNKMKLLRKHPTLYEHYQQRLKVAETEINGKDLLVAFLKEYKEELDEFEKEEDEAGGFAATLGSLNASMHLEEEAAAFNQPTRTYRPFKERPSILAALNESMHQVTESFNTTINERMSLNNKMKLLRKHPTLYEHYQQRLKVAETEINGKDLLVAFLKEYKEELDEFEKEEDEAGGFAATLGSLNASMHLEAEAAAFNQPTRTYRPLKERPSILAALNASMHQVTESFNTTLHDHTLAGEAEESASHQSQNHSTRSDGFSERWKRVSTLFSASLEKDATGYPDGSDSERPLHRSRPIQFDPIIEENDDDDPFLNQASDIALRRRNGKGGPKTTLVSIEDMGEEDLEGSFVNVEVKDGEELTDPAEASSRDPMMEGTQHNDPRSGQPSNSGRDFNDHVLEKVTNKSPVAECDSRTKVVMNHVNDSKGRAVDEKESVDIENDGNSNSEDSLI